MTITLYKGDLPKDLNLGSIVAVDTETLGLNVLRDKLCVVQLSSGDSNAHLVQMDRNTYDCPNLKALLTDESITKIFHFARFDIAVLKQCLGIECWPFYCTRTASRLTRTYTDRHGLRENCRELLGVDLNKQQQSSDWGADELSEDQKIYAANDVLHLHALKEKLDVMLEREGRTALAYKCFDAIATVADLDLNGWSENMFAHNG